MVPPQRGIAILGGWMGVREREGPGHQGGRSCPRTSLRPPTARTPALCVFHRETLRLCHRDAVGLPQRHCVWATETLCVPHRDTGQKKVSWRSRELQGPIFGENRHQMGRHKRSRDFDTAKNDVFPARMQPDRSRGSYRNFLFHLFLSKKSRKSLFGRTKSPLRGMHQDSGRVFSQKSHF